MNKELRTAERAKSKVSEAKKHLPISDLSARFHSLRKEMDDLVERFFGEKSSFVAWPESWFGKASEGMILPNIDVTETRKTLKVTAELPGLEADDIEVTVHDGVLSLEGEKKVEKQDKDEETRVMERRYGSFHRSFSLPANVDWDKARAAFKNGVLTVTFPKTGENKSKARTIKVN